MFLIEKIILEDEIPTSQVIISDQEKLISINIKYFSSQNHVHGCLLWFLAPIEERSWRIQNQVVSTYLDSILASKAFPNQACSWIQWSRNICWALSRLIQWSALTKFSIIDDLKVWRHPESVEILSITTSAWEMSSESVSWVFLLAWSWLWCSRI